MKHDLIILGRGPSKEGCPFDTEVWSTVSILRDKGWEDKPYSKLFLVEPQPPYGLQAQKLAIKRGLTIVSFLPLPFVSEQYPLFRIRRRFRTCFFMNSVSFMIALALYRGYKNLWLWGVDQVGTCPSGGHSYGIARPYTTYWLGMATGMGVQWELCPNSLLWAE